MIKRAKFTNFFHDGAMGKDYFELSIQEKINAKCTAQQLKVLRKDEDFLLSFVLSQFDKIAYSVYHSPFTKVKWRGVDLLPF